MADRHPANSCAGAEFGQTQHRNVKCECQVLAAAKESAVIRTCPGPTVRSLAPVLATEYTKYGSPQPWLNGPVVTAIFTELSL